METICFATINVLFAADIIVASTFLPLLSSVEISGASVPPKLPLAVLSGKLGAWPSAMSFGLLS